MSTERDELAEDIRSLGITVIDGPPVDLTEPLAQHLHNLGYRRPRTITTTEELDTLGHGSVIRSEHRHYWVAHKEDGMDGNQGWAATGTGRIPADLKAWLPATVLHEGATNV